MDKNHLKHIQTLFDDATAQKKMAGVNLLIYKDGNEIGYFQSGYADIKEKRLYDRNTICRMYSMTKPVTAVAALILVEEGKLDLSEELICHVFGIFKFVIKETISENLAGIF